MSDCGIEISIGRDALCEGISVEITSAQPVIEAAVEVAPPPEIDVEVRVMGDDGLTPFIGANGNWWIGEQDTGVKAEGPAGPQGERGAQGPQGPRGEPGRDGATGSQGPQGERGPAGETGAQGPMGPQGIQGPKGDKGDKGDTGADGQTGPQGPAGNDGAPGKDGKDGSPGSDGVSPTVNVEDIDGGHRVAITDANGTKTFDVMDGAPGDPGDPGDDGISPVVTVQPIDGGHRVTITDAEGEKSFDVMDGKDGEDGEGCSGGGAAIIDVTALPETDIKENVFYRLLTAEFYYNKTPQTTRTCEIVNVLPEVGEPATDATMTRLYLYYATSTGAVSGYIDQMLAYGLGIPIGWYPAETLFQVAGLSYGGVVSSVVEMTAVDTMYLLLQDSVKYHNNGAWVNVQGIGWTSEGTASEIFNSMSNTAGGSCSHAEGFATTASGDYSHAEGGHSHAEGNYSHAEGGYSHAEGGYSHAEGNYSHAAGRSQHVEGEFNVRDPKYVVGQTYARGKYVHITGNGTDFDKRSNAHTLDWNGVGWFAGGVKVGGTGQDDEASDWLVTRKELEADRAQIVSDVLAALPVYNGEVADA